MPLSHEQLVEILHHGQQYVRHNRWTDERGLSFFLGDCPGRTLRGWRQQKKGPPAYRAERWLYDLSEIVIWFNSQSEKEAENLASSGETRKT